MKNTPREGVTTGSAAAAAARAATELLLLGRSPESVAVPLPPFDASAPEIQNARLSIPIAGSSRPAGDKCASAFVVKDGGDDPDATHGARIEVEACLHAALAPREMRIEGGEGVGRVTLPGLPVAVGNAAVNPVPRAQIVRAVSEFSTQLAPETLHYGILLTIRVPEGERIARKTLNPRLGILGGISILGTHGIVRPYSHEAWQSVILQALDVALAAGVPQRGDRATLCLSTGRRSERLLAACYPALPPLCFIQAGDYAAFSLRAAAERGFTPLAWGCFFGKLLKLAQGLEYTHARTPLDMDFAARLLTRGNTSLSPEILAACVTASRILDILLETPGGLGAITRIAAMAKEQAEGFAGGPVNIHLFHTDGRELVTL